MRHVSRQSDFAVHFYWQCLTPSWTRAAVRLSGLWMVPVNDVPNLLVFNHALLVFKAASVEKSDQSIRQLRLLASDHLYELKLRNLNQIIS